jgi:signal transduction histidine kinase/DNA-binding LacI/PurR family transcriptional regulator/CheY-like chemotaxis protein/HPt (histidine-containing phosphotransfer) domain-containing protein
MEALMKKTIAYVTPFIWGDISLTYFKGVLQKAQEEDAHLVCYVGGRLEDQTNYNYQANIVYSMMKSTWVDGLIVWASQIGEVLPENKKNHVEDYFIKVPTVTIAGSMSNADSVYGDEFHGLQQLVGHMVTTHKHRTFAFIQGPAHHPLSLKRSHAFTSAMDLFQIPHESWIMTPPDLFNKMTGSKGIDYLIKHHGANFTQAIDCIVCVSDVVANGAIEALRARGYVVPKDIAVVGINNKLDSRISTPPLTTIDPQTQRMGYKAAELLFERIHPTRSSETTEYIVPSKLIVRRSCGCKEIANEDYFVLKENPHCISEKAFSLMEEEGVIKNLILDVELLFDVSSHFYEANFSTQWVTTFLKSIQDRNSTDFIDLVEETLFVLKYSDEDIAMWHNAIGRFSTLLQPYIHSQLGHQRAAHLLNQARLEVNLATEHQYAEHRANNDIFYYLLNEINESLRTTFEIDELLLHIKGILPKLKIPGCFIALFEDDYKETGLAKLIFAHGVDSQSEFPEGGILFRIENLLPDTFKFQKGRTTLIVHALYFQDKHIGYAVFEAGPIDKSIYTILCSEISGALYRSNIFNSLKLSELKREGLLKQLEEENLLLEQKVTERTEDINRANEAKSRFLANMSHEIRTPLNGIIGFADMIRTISKEAEVQKFIKLAIDEAEKLLLLINQLLDLSKIESGKFEIVNERTDIRDLLESLASVYSVNAQTKGLSFCYTIQADVHCHVYTDSFRIRQVLVNLIGNAIKFTSSGGIKVSVEQLFEDSEEVELLFSISDTGIGIESDRLEAIFELFVQEEEGTTRKFGGTGLGAAISKQLVELMGGKIGVESRKGIGSTFWFSLKMLKDPMATMEEPPNTISSIHGAALNTLIVGYEKAKILLVEDYEPNRTLALAYLKPLNCIVEVAENGMIALEMLKQQCYDVILMDVQMPVLDGVEATKYIRLKLKDLKTVIIGITANAFQRDIDHYLHIGMNAIVTKPFRKQSLLTSVMKWYDLRDSVNLPIDINKMLDELDQDKDLLKELIETFIDSFDVYIAYIQEGILTLDDKHIAQSAHTLKGAALNMSANLIAEAALTIEEAAKEHQDYHNYKDYITTLEEQCSSLKNYLKQVTL